MTIWIVLWLVLSVTILYFLGWTIFILLRQKQAWKTFAHKNKLRFTPNKFLSSPEMSGVLNDYTISFFTSEHTPADGRNARKMAAIEISLSSRMPFDGSIGSGGMVPLVRALGFKEEYAPSSTEWDKTWIAAGSNRNALEAYLTPARLKAFTSLMKLKNAWAILIFRDDIMLLRFDTADPLDNVEKLERLVKIVTDTARMLELDKGEDGKIKHAMTQKPRQAAVVEATKEVASGLALELEEAPPKPALPVEENKE